jgi:hypothetical protein
MVRIMSDKLPIRGLDEDERLLLIKALCALRDERTRQWNAACDQAIAQGKRLPGLGRYGIDGIKRLARRLGGKATYRLERQGDL